MQQQQTPAGGAGGQRAGSARATRQLQLSIELTDGLRGAAMRHELTLNTLIQGAWAILLSTYAGSEDVVFGAVTSGRSAPLPGIESARSCGPAAS